MNFLKRFIDRKEEVENCVICILRPLTESVPWIFPYDGYCRHLSRRHSETSHIRKNDVWGWIHHLFLIVATVGWLNNLYYICSIYGESEVQLLVLLSDALFNINAITLYAILWFKGNHYITALAIISAVIDGRSGLGNTNFLSPYYRKVSSVRCQVERYLIYFVHVFNFLAFLAFIYIFGFNTEALSMSLNCASGSVLLSAGIMLVHVHEFLEHINGVVLKNVRDDLEDPVILNAADGVLKKRFTRHMRLISALKFAADDIAKFLDPTTIVYITTAIATFIVDIYLFLVPWNGYYGVYIGYQQFRTIALVIFLFQMILRMDAAYMTEGTLSFLYRYPISKLTRQQADQVEMLTIGLEIQRPVVIASDSVFISKRLIATIVGTVVTYVLVALQFRAARTKPE